MKKVGNKEWFDYGGDSNEWEGFNGFDFCNKIEADCVEIEVDGAATVMPGDFQNCKKLVISTVVSDSTYGRDDNGRESYEHELEVIDKINHKNIHLRLNDTISIIDHPGLHDGAKVWKMDDVQKFLDRLVSFCINHQINPYLKTPLYRIHSSPVQSLTYPSLSNEIDYNRHPNREVDRIDKNFDATSQQFKTDFMNFYKTQPIYRGWECNVYYTLDASLRDYHSAYNRGAACYQHMYEGWNEI